MDGIEGIEISNGRHGEFEKAIAIRDRLLMSGRRITGVGSSDWHSDPNPIDNANARVFARQLTQEYILAGIRAGHVIVMTNADDPTPEIVFRSGAQSAMVGDELPVAAGSSPEVSVSAPGAPSGRFHVIVNGKLTQSVALDAEGFADAELEVVAGYVRIEVVNADGSAHAYGNPVYLVKQ